MLDKRLADFSVQTCRFVYFNSYLLFQDTYSKLLPLKNVMRETQLKDIWTISLLIAEGWVQVLYTHLALWERAFLLLSHFLLLEKLLCGASLTHYHSSTGDASCSSGLRGSAVGCSADATLCLCAAQPVPHHSVSYFMGHKTFTAPSPGHQHQRLVAHCAICEWPMWIARCDYARCWGRGGSCLLLHFATRLQLTWVLWETQGSQSLLCVMKLRFYLVLLCITE